jgi:glycosyltransferase involved in cell wall biosynthesis
MFNFFSRRANNLEKPRDPNEKPVIDRGCQSKQEHIPFFSVCIPTYNRASLLSQAIESVLAQDFTDFELIVCDNASTDNTEEIVKSYEDARIRYIKYADLVSMYANHNRCIDLARADWVVFLHSDDLLESNSCSIYHQVIKETKDDNLAVLYPSKELHDCIHWNDYNCTFKSYLLNQPSLLYQYPAGTPSGAAYKTSSLVRFQFNEKSICADLDILLTLSKARHNILLINYPILKIGTQQERYTTDWMVSGQFIEDVSLCLYEHLSEIILTEIIKNIDQWSEGQIARLLMFFAFQNQQLAIKKIEKKLSSKMNNYGSYRDYRHVLILKFLGYPIYRVLYFFVIKIRIIKFRINQTLKSV